MSNPCNNQYANLLDRLSRQHTTKLPTSHNNKCLVRGLVLSVHLRAFSVVFINLVNSDKTRKSWWIAKASLSNYKSQVLPLSLLHSSRPHNHRRGCVSGWPWRASLLEFRCYTGDTRTHYTIVIFLVRMPFIPRDRASYGALCTREGNNYGIHFRLLRLLLKHCVLVMIKNMSIRYFHNNMYICIKVYYAFPSACQLLCVGV